MDSQGIKKATQPLTQNRLQVCIIGCTNKGKSTLFNLLCGKKLAITHDSPGVTIDCRTAELTLEQIPIHLSDTPGFDEFPKNTAESIAQIEAQIKNTVTRADLILHLIDASTVISHFDRQWSQFYLKQQKKALVVVNMIDKCSDQQWEHTLRFNNCPQIGISAKTRQGINQLKQEITSVLQQASAGQVNDSTNIAQADASNPCSQHSQLKIQRSSKDPKHGIESKQTHSKKQNSVPEKQGDLDQPAQIAHSTDRMHAETTAQVINLCIVGRPNAGKSTLSNRLSGHQKSIVSAQAGTTVDTVNHGVFQHKNQTYQLLDTAGLRKKSRIHETVESYAAHQSIMHLKAKNTLIIHMIDATQGISDQDYRVLSTIEGTRNRHLILINKWDLLQPEQKEIYRKHIDNLAKNRTYIPVVLMSAAKDANCKILLNTLHQLSRQHQVPPMSYLTKCVMQITTEHRPPMVQNKMIKIRVCYPTPNRYASITIQGKRIKKLPLSYQKYLQNTLQKALKIKGIKLEIVFKEDHNPYS